MKFLRTGQTGPHLRAGDRLARDGPGGDFVSGCNINAIQTMRLERLVQYQDWIRGRSLAQVADPANEKHEKG